MDGVSIICKECANRITPAQREEFLRIDDDYGWNYGRGFKPNHLERIFRDAVSTNSCAPALPFVALLHIFVMLTQVCKSGKDYMRASLNFLLAMASVAEPRLFLNHLRVVSPSHHKMWHDFLMLAKYSPYLCQTIPECFGKVCYVSPERNPQIAKEYLDGTGPDTSHQKYRQETTIAICSCSHQTMCDTEEECFHHDMPADGNCNVISTNTISRHYRNYYDWELFDYKKSDIDEFAIDFFMQAEKAYQKKFLSELRYNIWLQSTLADETELATEFAKSDTQRIIRETARMRLEKTKHKNSRRSRQVKFDTVKGSNTGKNKSRRDVCLD